MTSTSPPDYYTWHPVCECKDIVSHFPYNPGVAIAYIWRAGRKPGADPVDDLQKAIDHLWFEIDRITAQRDAATENRGDQ